MQQEQTIRTELPLPPFALTFDLTLTRLSAGRVEARMRRGQVARLLVTGDPYHLHLPDENQTQRVAARLQQCHPVGDDVHLTFHLEGTR